MNIQSLRQGRVVRLVARVLVGLFVLPAGAFAQTPSPPPALPQGGQVVQGSAAIAMPSASQMVITQTSDRAIVNWRDFSIGDGARVQIQQPGAASALLNKVTGENLSRIDGQLQANGQVYLLNPRGVVVGPNGTIDTAAFLASALRVPDQAFMAGGALEFSGGDAVAGVVNLGTIRASTGDVVLLAPIVVNRGNIAAPGGTAALASGGDVLYAPGESDSILIKAPLPSAPDGAAVENSGVITAAQAELKAAGSPYALAINISGLVAATSLTSEGGRIVLHGGDGDIQVGETGVLRANAGVRGDGGTIRVGSGEQGRTLFAGTAEARGGAEGGNGGFVEVSGRELQYSGRTDTTAPNGQTGMLLLDPLIIDGTTATTIGNTLDTTNVTELAADSITVSAPIANATTTHRLTLDAPVVTINADITLPNGILEFGQTDVAGTSVTSASSASIDAQNVDVYGGYQTVNLAGPVTSTYGLGYSPVNATLTSLNVNNAANAISFLNLTNGTTSITGNVDVRTTTAMTVSGGLTVNGNLTFVADGNLVFSAEDTITLNVGGTTTLASTGGVFKTNNLLELSGAGRKIIYSSTDGTGFDASGLVGYTQVSNVNFQSDPMGSGNVIYIGTGSGLPLMTITADDKTISYGSADPTYTASLSGGSASDLTSPVQFRVLEAHTDAGSYTIQPYGAASTTRSLAYVEGTLTITPATLMLRALDATREYGAANPSFSATASPFFNGDSFDSVVSNLSFSTAPLTAGVGTYAITPSATSASRNYTISVVPGTLTVTPASLLVTANDVSRVYGGANPTFSASYSGLVNGDVGEVVAPVTLSTVATPESPVRLYEIVPTLSSVSPNYTVSLRPGALSVTRAPLTVTVHDATRTYGSQNPAFSTTVSGLVNGDTESVLGTQRFSTAATAASNVGSYPVSVLHDVVSNYTVQAVDGTLTVTPAPLTIVARDARRRQNAENPAFTALVAGLVNGDTVNDLQFTTPAEPYASKPGTYPIVPSVGSMPNYTVSVGNGTLTVTQPEQVLVYESQDGSSLPQAFKDLQKQMQTTWDAMIRAAESEPIVVTSTFFLGAGPGMLSAGSRMVDKLVADLAAAGIKTTAATIFQALDDPALRATILAILTPYLEDEVRTVLAIDAKDRTVEQQTLLANVEQFIREQKIAAATKGQQDYEEWRQGQQDKMRKVAGNAFEEEGGGIGVAGIYLGAIEAANPEGPPPEYLDAARAGVVLTNEQAITFMDMTDQLNRMAAEAGKQVAANNGVPSTSADATVLQPITVASDLGKVLSFVPQAMADVGGGTNAFADALHAFLTGEQWVRTTSGGVKLGTGTGRFIRIDLIAEIDQARKIGDLEAVAKLQKELNALDEVVDVVTETTEAGVQLTKTVSTTAKTMQAVGQVLAVAGVVLEVVGNAVQIGIGVAGYARLSDYEKALADTAAAAKTPITDADLASMPQETLSTYLTLMLAGGGTVGAGR